MNSFTYNGQNSLDFGVRIKEKNVYSAPAYGLTYQSIPGRDGDLLQSERCFKNIVISYTCFIPASSVSELAEKTRQVKEWLYTAPDRYHILRDTYNEGFFRKGVIHNQLDISDVARRIGQFVVRFNCQPWLYADSGETTITRTSSSFTLSNPYGFESKPYIRLYGSGSGTLTIQGDWSNRVWQFTDVADYIEIDSALMNFYKGTVPKNNTVTGSGFPSFAPGTNAITLSGFSRIEIEPRWRTL